MNHKAIWWIQISVADPDPFDRDPAFRFDTDPDPTVSYGSGPGSLLFQRGNVPKSVLFAHLYFIFLVIRSNRTNTKNVFFLKFSLPVHFVWSLQ
jgi:hypothetical protein